MIRRIGLTNWRAYERAEIVFDEGTTFVVAANGIGKSSLLEAVEFAFCGRIDSVVSPVTLGTDVATVEVDLELPGGSAMTVRRSIVRGTDSNAAVDVWLDGVEVTAERYVEEIDRSYGASPDFVARNALLRDSLRGVEHTNLRALLARAFELDVKRNEATRLGVVADELKRDAEQMSRDLRSEERAVGRLQAEVEAADAAVVRAGRDLDAARKTVEGLTEARDTYLASQAAAQAVRRWQDAATEVLAAVRALVPGASVDTMDSEVERVVTAAESFAVRTQEQVAAARAWIELIGSSMAELEGAGAECPVCRRPLGVADRAAAHAGHEAELELLGSELGQIDLDGALRAVADARALAARIARLGARPVGPAPADVSFDPQEDHAAALVAFEGAVSARDIAARTASNLRSELEAALDAAQRSAENEQAWRRWALTSAAATTLLRSIDDVLDREVRPVRERVESRWNELFQDRSGLEFDLDGNIWRVVNGERLDVDGFSAGEQTAARILMQLAILVAATTVDFCWFDEPLEHLDPRARRHVANLLAQGREATGLRQFVVTTYEEELAAQLAAVVDSARIEYVRAGPTSQPAV